MQGYLLCEFWHVYGFSDLSVVTPLFFFLPEENRPAVLVRWNGAGSEVEGMLFLHLPSKASVCTVWISSCLLSKE